MPTIVSQGVDAGVVEGDGGIMALKVLVLGGTTEARRLSERLSRDPSFDVLVSFAGRTAHLQPGAVRYRVGGFGGASGLAEFLLQERFEALVDATHPFAAQMSAHAVQAASSTGLPFRRLERPAWTRLPDDVWHGVPNMLEAARALGAAPRRVFLSIGRQEIAAFATAPQHAYLVRAVDPFDPGLPHARVIAARGPFALEDELALLRRERVEVLVSKNSGTDATYAKILAARELRVPVIMVERPVLAPAPLLHDLDDAVRWLGAVHERAVQRRGA